MSAMVRAAIRRALIEGCKKHTNVFFYGPNTSGKSHVVKPLAEIFKKKVFKRPVGTSNFALKDIFGKKVCVLQDVRVSTFKIGFDSLLVWWEGESFPVPLPQNKYDGDKEYTERAPVFVTAGAKFRIPKTEAEALQVNAAEQDDMMDARFQYFFFPHTLKKEEKVEVAPCAHCFAKWVVNDDLGASDQICTPCLSQSQASCPALPPHGQAQPTNAQAKEAITDWMETHGGVIRLTGEQCNLAGLADALCWSQKFLPSVGRLVPFLHKYGVAAAPDVVIGFI